MVSAAQGLHYHLGSTSAAADHTHAQRYTLTARYVSSNSDGNSFAVSALAPTGGSNAGGVTDAAGGHFHTFGTSSDGQHVHGITASASLVGGNAAMNWLPPFLLTTPYIKL